MNICRRSDLLQAPGEEARLQKLCVHNGQGTVAPNDVQAEGIPGDRCPEGQLWENEKN
jgi:hypothetical protein